MSDEIVKDIHLAVNNAADFLIEDDLPPLIPPGTYNMMLESYQTALMFQGKAPKLILWFRIVSHGKAFGERLPRYYNVKNLVGNAQINGRFKVSPKGDFLREYFSLFRVDVKRLDRLPMSHFHGVTIQAEIKTVKQARGKDIPKPLRYSKVDRLLKVIER